MQRLAHVITREQSTIGDGHRGMLALKELLKEFKVSDNPKLQVADHFTKARSALSDHYVAYYVHSPLPALLPRPVATLQ